MMIAKEKQRDILEECSFIRGYSEFIHLSKLTVFLSIKTESIREIDQVYFSDRSMLNEKTAKAYQQLVDYINESDSTRCPVRKDTEMTFGLKEKSNGTMEFHLYAEDPVLDSMDEQKLVLWLEDINRFAHNNLLQRSL